MTARLVGYLRWIEHLASQPADRWNGFTVPRSDNMNFGLRFQIAFSGYALGAIGLCEPSLQPRCQAALAALIDRFLSPPVWAYWRAATGSLDPVARANIQYSGHLGHLLGVYKRLDGDDRYDQAWHFDADGASRAYTHRAVVEAIHGQMVANPYHGVECEQGCTYVSCNDHALWATRLYDQVHGSHYADANRAWLAFLEERLMFRGPRLPGRGAVTAIYSTRLRRAAPLGLNFMDAWALALLAPLAPALVRKQARRLWPRLHYRPDGSAYLPSAAVWQRMEGADVAVNTGFAFVLAVELGETARAAALLRYAEHDLQPLEDEGTFHFGGGLAPAYTTALFAIGEAGGLGQMLTYRAQAAGSPAT